MPSLSAFEQSLPTSSSSFIIPTGTNMTTDTSITNTPTLQKLPPQHATRKRKRRNSTMIIKQARWSPPLQPHHPSNALTTSIETDFQPTFYNPNEIKHRRRISSQQYGILEDEYLVNTKPNASKRHYLAELLGMTPRTVQIWFQNKRAKAKHQQGKPRHAEKKSRPSSSKSLAAISPSSPPRSSSTVSEPADQFIFDDGRLDPIYLMDDYDMTAFMIASSSPSLSSTTSTVNSSQNATAKQNSWDDCIDEKKNGNVVFMDGISGQYSSMSEDHGTKITAPVASSASPSPHLPSSDTQDSFTMGLHHLANTNQQQHQCYDETPFSASTASSSPSQQFSPLDSSFTHHQYHDTQQKVSTYSIMDTLFKGINTDQELLLRHDTHYILDWIQKTPMDFPIGGSLVPSWSPAMNQPDLQNDCLNFGLDHDDWMDPFSVSA